MMHESVTAILIMADGVQINLILDSIAYCVEFTRQIAPYVESANCFAR
jgi:hypothetical protein